MADDVDCVLDARAALGELPFWSAADQSLYWIDIRQPALHRFDPASSMDRHWTLPAEVGCYALRRDGSGALVGLRSGVFALDFATGALQKLAEPPYDPELFRFNEGGCDDSGRFWLGTMFEPIEHGQKDAKQRSHWHSYTSAKGLRTHDDEALTPNGLAWTPDFAKVFFAHTESGRIFVYDYDREGGHLRDRRLFAQVPKDDGKPDGAALDVDGCYWSALHAGARLRRFRPDGRVERDVILPVTNPTMCAFGGEDLDVLYVTSAREKLSPEQVSREPQAGGIFAFRPGVRGRELPKFG